MVVGDRVNVRVIRVVVSKPNLTHLHEHLESHNHYIKATNITTRRPLC